MITAVIIAVLAVCAILAIAGSALSVVHWHSSLRATELLRKK